MKARTPDPLDGWAAIDSLSLRDEDKPINCALDCAVAAWMSLTHSGAFVALFRDIDVVPEGGRRTFLEECGVIPLLAPQRMCEGLSLPATAAHEWIAFLADGIRATLDGWTGTDDALRWANSHLAGVR